MKHIILVASLLVPHAVPATAQVTPAPQQAAPVPLQRVVPVRDRPPTAEECAAMRKTYAESKACFAPYLNRNGSLKPGAFQNCKEEIDPTYICGAPSIDPHK